MKYVGITKTGEIRCTRKDGETKNYKAEEAVVAFARKAFKKDDYVVGEFTAGVLVKLEKYQSKKSGYNGGNKGGCNNASSGNIDAQSAVKSASQAITGLTGLITLQNYTEIYKSLITIGLNAITGSAKTTKDTKAPTTDDGLEDAGEAGLKDENELE